MSRDRTEMRCGCTQEELQQVRDHVKAKKKWPNIAAFIRYCVFTEIDRNKAGAHRRAGIGEGVGAYAAPEFRKAVSEAVAEYLRTPRDSS